MFKLKTNTQKRGLIQVFFWGGAEYSNSSKNYIEMILIMCESKNKAQQIIESCDKENQHGIF